MCLLLGSSWLTMTAAAGSRRQGAAPPGRTAALAEPAGVAGGAPAGERHVFSRGLPQCRARPAVWAPSVRCLVLVRSIGATLAEPGLCNAMAERRSSAPARRPSGFVTCSQTLGGANAGRPPHDGCTALPSCASRSAPSCPRFPAGGDERVLRERSFRPAFALARAWPTGRLATARVRLGKHSPPGRRLHRGSPEGESRDRRGSRGLIQPGHAVWHDRTRRPPERRSGTRSATFAGACYSST